MAVLEAIQDLVFAGLRVIGIGVNQRSDLARGFGLVGNLRGIGVNRIGLHGHGQLVQVAVVENAAARRHFKRALLLLLRALHEFLVAHDLQSEEPGRDGAGPEEKKQADKPEARHPQREGARHGFAIGAGPDGSLHGEMCPAKV